jgi:putative transposase
MPRAHIGRKVAISLATDFNWKKRYEWSLPAEMRRLKQFDDANTKRRTLVVDLSLDREMLRDVIHRKL